MAPYHVVGIPALAGVCAVANVPAVPNVSTVAGDPAITVVPVLMKQTTSISLSNYRLRLLDLTFFSVLGLSDND